MRINRKQGLWTLCVLMVATAVVGTDEPETTSIEAMTIAARHFLVSLSPDQRTQTQYSFEADERFDWHFIPKTQRKGLSLKEMRPEQAQLAHVLLIAGLSVTGYSKTLMIMSLEDLARQLDQQSGNASMLRMRDPELYYFTIFGEPAEGGTWGWSVEGHHVSLNFTVAKGKLSAAGPAFFGARPHNVRSGPRMGLRVLGKEEDLARELLGSLTPLQRKQAVLSNQAPRDIFTGAKRKVEFEAPPKGLSAASMDERQKRKLQKLILEYIQNLPADLAKRRKASVAASDPDAIHFAWMGETEEGIGRPHYYRVQATNFLIEYDNIQNNANHSHTVWRDYDGDFGLDLLAEHHGSKAH